MSKIKISGNASGTGVVTLTAPNTNTDRTITLPDGDITLGGGVDGIVSTANATAITIDANENVGIGTATPSNPTHIYKDASQGSYAAHTPAGAGLRVQDNANSLYIDGNAIVGTGAGNLEIGTTGATSLMLGTNGTERLKITNDGRGLSQFTAKAWVNFNGTGTVAVNDSHNVSSITDNGTGSYYINLSNAMGNTSYVTTAMSLTGNSNASSKPNTSSQIIFLSRDINGTSYDWNPLQCLVFGD